MPQYTVTDPTTKRTVTLTGASPPTEAELTNIFAQLSPAPSKAAADAAYEDEANRISGGQIVDLGKGAAKGAARTAVGFGRAWHMVPGVDRALGDMPSNTALGLDPSNDMQRYGMGAEQIGEFLIPGGAAERGAATMTAKLAPYFRNTPRLVKAATKLVPKMVTQGTTTAGLTAAQGGDATTAGAVAAAVPVGGAVAEQLSPFLRSKAEYMVRTAIKPTVTALKRIAGASAEGLDAKAEALVRFIIDHKLTTADKARKLFADTENELKVVLSMKNAVTDAPQRASRYLATLERSAAKQGLPADDVAQISNAAADLLKGPMGEDVITMVPTPHPTLVGPNGQPITVMRPQVTRQLRTDVQADEALASARSSSRWSTNKQWGEQKGTTTEATKAVERAQRDATKAAVPEAKDLLRTESNAIKSTEVLDRMQHRQANREDVSLPAHVLAAGGHGVLAFASNWLRNNGLKAGIWADRLSKAVATNNASQAAWILSRLGVGAEAQQGNPAYAK